MAILKSDIIEAKDSLSISDKAKVDGDKTGATVLQATATYVTKAGLASGDIIEITDLPPTAVVVPELSYLSFGYREYVYDNAQVSVDLGYKGDTTAARFGTAQLSVNGGSIHSAFGYNASLIGLKVAAPLKETTRLVGKINSLSVQPGTELVFGISYRIKG